MSVEDLVRLRSVFEESPSVDLHPIDAAVADATNSIPRGALGDPWDRFILGTARTLDLPLVTRDMRIRKAGLAEVVW